MIAAVFLYLGRLEKMHGMEWVDIHVYNVAFLKWLFICGSLAALYTVCIFFYWVASIFSPMTDARGASEFLSPMKQISRRRRVAGWLFIASGIYVIFISCLNKWAAEDKRIEWMDTHIFSLPVMLLFGAAFLYISLYILYALASSIWRLFRADPEKID